MIFKFLLIEKVLDPTGISVCALLMNNQLTYRRSFCASRRDKTRSRCSHHRSQHASNLYLSWLFHCRICTRVVSPFARANGATEAHIMHRRRPRSSGRGRRRSLSYIRRDGKKRWRNYSSPLPFFSLSFPLTASFPGSWHTRAEP